MASTTFNWYSAIETAHLPTQRWLTVAAKEMECSDQLVEVVKMLNMLQSVKITWEFFLASGEKSAITRAVEHISVNEVLWQQDSHTDSKLEVFSYRKPHFSPTLLLNKILQTAADLIWEAMFSKDLGALQIKGIDVSWKKLE